jgi:hypothetical protein
MIVQVYATFLSDGEGSERRGGILGMAAASITRHAARTASRSARWLAARPWLSLPRKLEARKSGYQNPTVPVRVGECLSYILKACRSTATCSTSAVPLVKSLGVDDVIDYSHDDFSRRSGFDVVFDTVGGDVRARSWQVLKPGGILITITLPEPNAIPRTDVREVLVRNRPDGARLAKVAKLIDAGTVRPLIAGIFDLGNVDRAIARGREGHVHGKLIVRIGSE